MRFWCQILNFFATQSNTATIPESTFYIDILELSLFCFHPQYQIPEGIENYIKGGTLDSTSCVNSQDAAAKLLRYNIELNLWMVTDMRCRRCWVSLASPVQSVIRRPSSVRRACPRSLKKPRVSMIFGQKQDVVDSSTYFSIFFSDARSTTTVSSTTCTPSHPGLSTASVVSGCGWRTTDSSSSSRKLNLSGFVRLVVWPSVRSSRSWSTVLPFFPQRPPET